MVVFVSNAAHALVNIYSINEAPVSDKTTSAYTFRCMKLEIVIVDEVPFAPIR